MLIQYGGETIGAMSMPQKCTALSSTKAEYPTLSGCCKSIKLLRQVLNELGENKNESTIYQDNNGSVDWTTSGLAKKYLKRKHIDVQYHFLMDCFKSGGIRLDRCLEMVQTGTFPLNS